MFIAIAVAVVIDGGGGGGGVVVVVVVVVGGGGCLLLFCFTYNTIHLHSVKYKMCFLIKFTSLYTTDSK